MPDMQHMAGVTPTIVCQDIPALEMLLSWYAHSQGDRWIDRLTNYRFLEQTGPPTPEPSEWIAAMYGCNFIPRGTPVTITNPESPMLRVSGKLASGESFKGITMSAMIDQIAKQ